MIFNLVLFKVLTAKDENEEREESRWSQVKWKLTTSRYLSSPIALGALAHVVTYEDVFLVGAAVVNAQILVTIRNVIIVLFNHFLGCVWVCNFAE